MRVSSITPASSRRILVLSRGSCIAAILVATSSGCTQAAGLHEHEAYKGFPDSLSVSCSDGIAIVECKDVLDIPQDGHYLNPRPSFQVAGVEVTDTITKLTWYTTAGEVKNYDEAVRYCDVLPGDYRLPTRIELVSLLDFRPHSKVRIDTDIFPTVMPIIHYSKSHYGNDGSQYWGVDFCADCVTSTHVLRSVHVSNHGGALCVKDAGEPFKTGPFEVAGVENRFLRDTRTGLMWMKTVEGMGTTWELAGKACKNAPDGAYGDFRLPNAKELATIIDDEKASGTKTLLHNLFEVGDEYIWSSTPSPKPPPAMPDPMHDNSLQFLTLHTGGGSIGELSGTLGYIRSLCVRGPD